MRNDEWRLTQELRRLNKYGFYLWAKRCPSSIYDYRYDIVFSNSGYILEPYCSIEEVMGIINSVDTCLKLVIGHNSARQSNANAHKELRFGTEVWLLRHFYGTKYFVDYNQKQESEQDSSELLVGVLGKKGGHHDTKQCS